MYENAIQELLKNKDFKYREFHSKLCTTKYEIIGVRLPILRKLAKEISKSDYKEYLENTKSKYYEEVLLEGLVISNIKDEKEFFTYFKKYIKKIDNWALCDTFCNSVKIVRKYGKKYFNLCLALLEKEKEYEVRVGLVMILSHFIKKEYLNDIFTKLDGIKIDTYYVNMAISWLVAELYIKEKNETIKYIKNNNLNKFTHNKAISKIHDSFRVTKEEKEYLNTLRK